MKVHVITEKCQGHGRCYTLAPQLLDSDDEGFVTVKGSSLEVPPELAEAARRAMRSCPEDAITLTE